MAELPGLDEQFKITKANNRTVTTTINFCGPEHTGQQLIVALDRRHQTINTVGQVIRTVIRGEVLGSAQPLQQIEEPP
ncbi:hypothetical protein D3C80_1706890 [compost metagenome]